jgi:hypothetical protein
MSYYLKMNLISQLLLVSRWKAAVTKCIQP